jgi:hypothetical protein
MCDKQDERYIEAEYEPRLPQCLVSRSLSRPRCRGKAFLRARVGFLTRDGFVRVAAMLRRQM